MGFFSLRNSFFISFSLIKCFYLFSSIHLVIVISLFTAGTGSVQEQREANRERIREQQRAHYRANRTRLCEYQRQYYASHREQIRERRRLHRQTHLERIRQSSRRYYYTRRRKCLEIRRRYRANHREQIRDYRQRYRDTSRRRELGSCLLEGLATDARPSHVIDTAGGGWLVRKYGLRPPTPPYLREGLARVDRLAPPASPSLSSDLSDAADRLDELLLRASPTLSSSIASDVVAELNDLVPPRPEPARRSTRLAQRPQRPPAAPEEDEEPVVDAAQIVLRRVRANRARSQARAEVDHEQRQAALEREQRIQNAIREVVVRPGPDLDLARAAAQFEREDRVGSCVAAEFFADTSCFEEMSFGELLEF